MEFWILLAIIGLDDPTIPLLLTTIISMLRYKNTTTNNANIKGINMKILLNLIILLTLCYSPLMLIISTIIISHYMTPYKKNTVNNFNKKPVISKILSLKIKAMITFKVNINFNKQFLHQNKIIFINVGQVLIISCFLLYNPIILKTIKEVTTLT